MWATCGTGHNAVPFWSSLPWNNTRFMVLAWNAASHFKMTPGPVSTYTRLHEFCWYTSVHSAVDNLFQHKVHQALKEQTEETIKHITAKGVTKNVYVWGVTARGSPLLINYCNRHVIQSFRLRSVFFNKRFTLLHFKDTCELSWFSCSYSQILIGELTSWKYASQLV